MDSLSFSGCCDERPEFGGGDLFDIDAAVGEAGESAVGVEEDLVGAPELAGLARAGDDVRGWLDVVGSRVDAPEADLAVGERASDDREFPGARSGEFEDQLIDRHGGERGDQRLVIAGDRTSSRFDRSPADVQAERNLPSKPARTRCISSVA